MTDSTVPKPQYTIWQAISTALALSLRAIEEIRALAREPGPKGDKGDEGPPGKSAFSIDDLLVEQDGDRVAVFKYRRGGEIKEIGRISFPFQLYRGVHKHGQAYERGDAVTWDGSTWHCNEPTTDRPGDGNKAWQLSVRKGRDGKDGSSTPPSSIPFGDK